MRNGIRSLPRYQQGGLVAAWGPEKEENRLRAMAGERGYASIGPRPSWAERIAAQVRSVPRRINRALQPETAEETAALVGASMIPGVGEGIDIADIAAGARTSNLPRIGWGLAGLALPFVAGSTLRQIAKRGGINTLLSRISRIGEFVDPDTGEILRGGVLNPNAMRHGLGALGRLPSRIARKWGDIRLPMDEASLARRLDEQGYERLLHGSSKNLPLELDPDRAFFQTSNPDVAEAYGEARRVYSRKPNQLTFDAEGAPWHEIPIEKIRRQIDPGRLEEFDRLLLNKFGPREYNPSGTIDTDTLSRLAREMGYGGFDAHNLRDAPWTSSIPGPDVSDVPSLVRSTVDPGLLRYEGARFDPRYLGQNLPLSGIAGLLGVGAAGAARRNYVERQQ